MPQRVLAWFNLLPIWKRQLRVWQSSVAAPTFDRALYLGFHRLGWMGGEQKAFLEQTVRPGMHVLDIGANIGLYTLLLSRLVGPAGTVIAFEPDPQLFEALTENCRKNSVTNVHLCNLAVGAHSGTKILFRSLLNAGDNRLAEVDPSDLRRAVEVRVATVDEIVGDRPVDFIKIDTQGWEGEVLAGMQRVLARNSTLQICLEYWPSGLKAAGYNPVDLLSGLTRMGFHLYQHIDGRSHRISDFADISLSSFAKYTDLHAVRSVATTSVAPIG